MVLGSRERGASTLEYLGVVIAGVILVLGMLLVPAAEPIKNTLGAAVCAVTTKGDFGAGPEASCVDTDGDGTPDSPHPGFEPTTCTVSTAGTTHKVDISIAIIDAGGSHGVSIAEIRHADGTVEYMVTHTGEGNGGVGVGIGGKGESGEGEGGVNVGGDLGIKGAYKDGTTYRTSTLEEAQALQQQLLNNPWNNGDREPVTETVTWSGEVNGSIDLGLGLPGDDEGGGDGGESTDGPNLGVGAGINGTHSYQTVTNNETGEVTYTTSWSGEISGNGDVLEGVNASGKWKGTTSVSVVRDADGNVVRVVFTTAQDSGATLKVGDKTTAAGKEGTNVVTTSTLTVTDSNRDTVEAWMGSADSNYLGLAPLGTIFWDPTQPSSDPMINLLYNEAVISQVSTENSEHSYEIGGEVKWGLKLGASYTYTDSTGQVVSAQYAGAPNAGSRPWLNMEVCFP